MSNKNREKPLKESRGPALKLTVEGSAKPGKPPFPDKKKSLKKPEAEEGITSARIGGSSDQIDSEQDRLVAVEAAGALIDLPFRGAHLIFKDVDPLTKEEIEYLADPLAKILLENGWSDKLAKAPYVKFGWGISVAVIARVRAHRAFVAAERRIAGKGPANLEKTGPGLAQDQRSRSVPGQMTAEKGTGKAGPLPPSAAKLEADKLEEEREGE